MKEEIHDRIRSRRLELHLTQAMVGKAVGVSRVSVTKWETGVSKPDGENLQLLAKVLNCSPDWLLYGGDIDADQTDNTQNLRSIRVFKVPVISWVQAGAWTDTCTSASLQDVHKWSDVTIKVSSNAFGLEVVGHSMTDPTGSPSIPHGSTVIVEPNYGSIDDLNNKIVVALLDGSSEATIKKLMIDGHNKYLVALNPVFRPIEINGNCKIIGRVVQVIQTL